jgi:3-oxoacyl-[acyl-carrier protein] reductase
MAKRVLVTGSSRGIGRAIATRLGEEGWNVAVHYSSSASEANECAKELGERAAGVYQADLSGGEAAGLHLAQKVLEDGPLDAVVNNAGVYEKVDFLSDWESVKAAYNRTWSVNWHAPLALTHACCRHFAERGGGKVLNIASRAGQRGEKGASSYSTTKAALINLTRALAMETADQNIQHFGIAPGWVETAMGREGMKDRLPDILKTIPAGRVASVDDCAALASFLLKDEASYLTGVVIDLNGASYIR